MSEEHCLFETLRGSVSEGTMKGIEDTGFKTMTEIQEKSIVRILEGRDLRATAKVGSGKTLAFLIPAIELVVQQEFKPSDGTGVIILSELDWTKDIFFTLKDMMKHHSQSYGLLSGGNREDEAVELLTGINIIVATPNRLLEHLKKTEKFMVKNINCLIIDDADRILFSGFEKEMKLILQKLSHRKQTVLFSETRGERVEELAKLALNSDFVEVELASDMSQYTTSGLKHSYLICWDDKRFHVLHAFLKKFIEEKKKVMILFRSCRSATLFNKLLTMLQVPTFCVHTKQNRSFNTITFFEFINADSGILLSTYICTMGWNIPKIDFILLFDHPQELPDYVKWSKKMSQTGKQGEAVWFINENQVVSIPQYLEHRKIISGPMDVTWPEVVDVQAELEEAMSKDDHLRVTAEKAMADYVLSLRDKRYDHIFQSSKIDNIKVGKCYGLAAPPHIPAKKQEKRKFDNRNFNSGNKNKFGKRF